MGYNELNQKRDTILSVDFFHKIAEHTDKVYKFVKLYNDYVNMPKDYGNGCKINMLGIHIMTAIEEHPGITASELTLGMAMHQRFYFSSTEEPRKIRIYP